MPFGVVFAALFFTALGVWLLLGGALDFLHAARYFLGPLALALAGGLLLRRRWAQWCALVATAALVGVALVRGLSGATASLAVLFGSVLALVLLVVPATGKLRPAPQRAPRLGRLFGVTAAVALLGALGSFWWGGAEAVSRPQDDSDARQAVLDLPARVAWSQFGDGLRRARAEAKPMLVSFETAWCGYCRKMNRETWTHPSVIERLGEIVAVRVDAEDDHERDGFTGRALADRYGVTGFPTILLVDQEGRVLDRTGGFLDPRQFLNWLERSLARLPHHSDALPVAGQ